MNRIDDIYNKEERSLTCIDGRWVAARPENHKKYMVPFWKRLKEAFNVLNGKAETLYYYKQ